MTANDTKDTIRLFIGHLKSNTDSIYVDETVTERAIKRDHLIARIFNTKRPFYQLVEYSDYDEIDEDVSLVSHLKRETKLRVNYPITLYKILRFEKEFLLRNINRMGLFYTHNKGHECRIDEFYICTNCNRFDTNMWGRIARKAKNDKTYWYDIIVCGSCYCAKMKKMSIYEWLTSPEYENTLAKYRLDMRTIIH